MKRLEEAIAAALDDAFGFPPATNGQMAEIAAAAVLALLNSDEVREAVSADPRVNPWSVDETLTALVALVGHLTEVQ